MRLVKKSTRGVPLNATPWICNAIRYIISTDVVIRFAPMAYSKKNFPNTCPNQQLVPGRM